MCTAREATLGRDDVPETNQTRRSRANIEFFEEGKEAAPLQVGGHLYTHCASAATVLSVGGPPHEHRIENIHGSPVFGPRPKGDAMGEWWLREVKVGMMGEGFGASGDVPSLRAIARRRREDGRPYLRSRTAPREREVRPSPRAWPTSRRYRPPPLNPRRESTSECAERKETLQASSESPVQPATLRRR